MSGSTTKEFRAGGAESGAAVTSGAASSARTRKSLPIERVAPDAGNRPIDEREEDFSALVDSIRVFGVLQPLHVHEQGGQFQIVDGERRWRAAKQAGLTEVPCEIWPASANPRDTLVVGVVLNEQRKAHRCIHVARRLREIKISSGLSNEQVAARTGLPLDRVKTYMCLFGGSEFLLDFFEARDVPLKVAAEFIRYEKATNEAKARKLALRHLETPLSQADVIKLRKRETEDVADEVREPHVPKQVVNGIGCQLERAWRKNPRQARAEVDATLRTLGYRLVAPAGGPVDGVA